MFILMPRPWHRDVLACSSVARHALVLWQCAFNNPDWLGHPEQRRTVPWNESSTQQDLKSNSTNESFLLLCLITQAQLPRQWNVNIYFHSTFSPFPVKETTHSLCMCEASCSTWQHEVQQKQAWNNAKQQPHKLYYRWCHSYGPASWIAALW